MENVLHLKGAVVGAYEQTSSLHEVPINELFEFTVAEHGVNVLLV